MRGAYPWPRVRRRKVAAGWTNVPRSHGSPFEKMDASQVNTNVLDRFGDELQIRWDSGEHSSRPRDRASLLHVCDAMLSGALSSATREWRAWI